MEDSRILEMYWERDEQAIAQTKMKYGAMLRALAYHIFWFWQGLAERKLRIFRKDGCKYA